jgi:hypothetical protein
VILTNNGRTKKRFQTTIKIENYLLSPKTKRRKTQHKNI